jgi:hypothetical protein
MKKLVLFAVSVVFAGMVNAQDCTGVMDHSATTLGLNPSPLAGSVQGVPYDEVNTLVLPGEVAAPLPPPNDTIALCEIRINNVIGMPLGYTYDVWAYHSSSPTSNYDVLAQTVDTVHMFQPITRICIRIKNPSPPASSIPVGTDGLADRDTAIIKIAVEAYSDVFGLGCNTLGATGQDTFEVHLAIKDNVYAGIGDQEEVTFTVGANHPNPAMDLTYLNFTTPTEGDVAITLYDAVGRVVRNIKMGSNVGANTYALNTSDLRSGVYMYNVSFGGKTISKKLIVNR